MSTWASRLTIQELESEAYALRKENERLRGVLKAILELPCRCLSLYGCPCLRAAVSLAEGGLDKPA